MVHLSVERLISRAPIQPHSLHCSMKMSHVFCPMQSAALLCECLPKIKPANKALFLFILTFVCFPCWSSKLYSLLEIQFMSLTSCESRACAFFEVTGCCFQLFNMSREIFRKEPQGRELDPFAHLTCRQSVHPEAVIWSQSTGFTKCMQSQNCFLRGCCI